MFYSSQLSTYFYHHIFLCTFNHVFLQFMTSWHFHIQQTVCYFHPNRHAHMLVFSRFVDNNRSFTFQIDRTSKMALFLLWRGPGSLWAICWIAEGYNLFPNTRELFVTRQKLNKFNIHTYSFLCTAPLALVIWWNDIASWSIYVSYKSVSPHNCLLTSFD